MMVGGSFGRKHEVEIAGQVALIAQKLGRPVQLIWSRAEDMAADRPRPAAHATYRARLEGGRIAALEAKIATTDGTAAMIARTLDQKSARETADLDGSAAPQRAVEGAISPYDLPAYALSHHPAALGVATGRLRGAANGFTCFFGESFIDELARAAGQDGFSFRMAMLASNVRLAQCLTRVALRGGWEGGLQGNGQGLACFATNDSYIAVMAEASLGADRRPAVTRLIAVADVGRVLNPDIARQQIEGGLLHGLALAMGSAITYQNGVPVPNSFAAHGWASLGTLPEVSVELIRSGAASGGIGELALPPVAPAIANAIHAGSGVRLRHLPLGGDTA
jgi:isoquinoline 1-oxidoreductase subunit beta